MSRKPPTDVTVYSPANAATREFEERIRAKIEQMAVVPSHSRSLMDVILGHNNTWDDHIHTQRKDAELSRAMAVAALARRDLALSYTEVAELPVEARRAAEWRASRHETVMLKMEYEREVYLTDIEELQNKRRLMRARSDHALRQLGVSEDSQSEYDPAASASASNRVQGFRNKFAEDQAIRAERDAQITNIRRSTMPEDEKEKAIHAVEERAEELLDGAGAS